MQEKFKQGPVGFLTVFPSGPIAMPKFLGLWFAYCLLIGFFVAYLTVISGAHYPAVFRVAGTAAFLAANGDPYERIGLDPQSDVQISLGSSGVPETFVIDGHGVIRRQYIGPLTAANVPGIVDELRSLR